MKHFLNVADDTLAPFISNEEYDASLVHHVLFQEHVLIEEGYLGDSSRTFEHIDRALLLNRNSLFLAALEEGVILPALREVDADPIANLFARWEKFYTSAFPILRPENSTLKNTMKISLSRAIENGANPVAWPSASQDSAEERYEELLRENLQRDLSEDETRRQGLSEIWQQTRAWRTDGIIEAAKRTKEAGRTGVSRAQIVNIVGESWNVPATPDGSQTLQILQASKSDPATTAFLRWATQCHHLGSVNK